MACGGYVPQAAGASQGRMVPTVLTQARLESSTRTQAQHSRNYHKEAVPSALQEVVDTALRKLPLKPFKLEVP